MADVNKTIQITYEAQTKDLEKALRRIPGITEAEVEKMSKEMKKHFKETERAAAKSSKRVGDSFKKAGKAIAAIGAGVAIAGAGVIAFGQHLADLSNELVDASTKTGLTVENLGGLRLAAEGAGVAFAQLEPGLIKLQAAIKNAAEGSGPAAEAFDRLGVNAKDAEGNLRNADDVFNDITASLSQVENQTEKSALAMDIFGLRAGPALLQSGALDNMQAFVDLSREFGINMEQNSQSMGEFQRAMAEITTVLQGVGADILMAITGTEGLTDGLFKVADTIVYFGSIGTDIIQSFMSVFGGLLEGLDGAIVGFRNLGLAIKAALTFDFSKVQEIVEGTTEYIAQQMSRMAEQIDESVDFRNMGDRAEEQVNRLQELRKNILQTSKSQAAADNAAREAAEKLAEAQEKATPKDDSAAREQAKALEELLGIRTKSVEALMTEEELEQMQFEQRLARIEELKEITGAVEEAELAAIAVRDEMEDKAHKRNMDRIAKETEARRTFIGIMTSSVMTAANAIESVLVDTGKITKEQAMKLHFLKQSAALTDIAVNTAVAITKANAALGPIAGGIATGALIASGAAQSAAVVAQPPPTFDMGGMIGNNDPLRPDETFVRALRGEAVLDRSTVDRLGGEQGVAALQRGETSGPQVVVISPFKHLDRYNKSALRRQSVLTKRFKPIGSGVY